MMPQHANGRIRTLVVEDKWLLRRATCRLLKQEPDIEVVGAAKDGAAALNKIEALQPDLVVTDIAMPELGGVELAFLLRRRFPAIRIVLVGIVDALAIPELYGLCGADALVNKALLPVQLPGVIHALFRVGEQSPKTEGAAVREANSDESQERLAYGPNW